MKKEGTSTNVIEDKQQILAVYERINDAMVNKDTGTLDNIFEDNHKFVHMSGYQQSKQKWLEQIENLKPCLKRQPSRLMGKQLFLFVIQKLMPEFMAPETPGV